MMTSQQMEMASFGKERICNFSNAGKYLNKVDRVMTQVDKITEDIDHMPVAAFIFKDKESDEVHYSIDIRYWVWIK